MRALGPRRTKLSEASADEMGIHRLRREVLAAVLQHKIHARYEGSMVRSSSQMYPAARLARRWGILEHTSPEE
jgi:hypothetical protein